jgi:hypothetical protein
LTILQAKESYFVCAQNCKYYQCLLAMLLSLDNVQCRACIAHFSWLYAGGALLNDRMILVATTYVCLAAHLQYHLGSACTPLGPFIKRLLFIILLYITSAWSQLSRCVVVFTSTINITKSWSWIYFGRAEFITLAIWLNVFDQLQIFQKWSTGCQLWLNYGSTNNSRYWGCHEWR